MRKTIICLLLLVIGSACNKKETKPNYRIGFSLDTLKEERWQRDRDYFVAAAEKLGVEVWVQSANTDDARQIAQCENFLSQGVDVLVIVPHDSKIMASIVEAAHKQNVKVLAYDRIINDCDLDFYISFDNIGIGERQAQYLVERVPKGNYVLIGGAPTDNNSLLLREGQMNVLQPYIDRGDIKIVADQWAVDWLPINALKHVENALTVTNNRVDAIVVSNDGTAGGAIQALEEQHLAGKVLVSGLDADAAACQRILAGTQSMTVYGPIRPLAEKAAEMAVKMIKGEAIPEATPTINNGRKDVPSVLLEPITVDKSNLYETVIKDGYQKLEEVYKNVPKEQWPVAEAESAKFQKRTQSR
jgi:D-xylose transport system substrate-binding protein